MKTKLSILVGNGKKIGLLVLPAILIGVPLNVLYPAFFRVGGPPAWLAIASAVVLVPGVVNWLWSVALILTEIPKKRLITGGPYAIMKHPLYVGVGLLVLPWAGFLLDTWLGLLLGVLVFFGSKLFAPEEEKILRGIFKEEWDRYAAKVLLPWL